MIDGSVLAAVSGGADSTAMLHMLAAAGGKVVAAHYNHGLREAADGDESFVQALCGQWGVPFVSERGAVPSGAGVEARARELRYDFLERVRAGRGLDWIATAHTADDNAETAIMNLTRGAGLSGLCGIPYRRGRILRPILSLSREDVLGYLAERDIPYRKDESNDDTAYRRNYIRHEVIPALKRVNPSLTDAVTRLTASLREDEAYLTELAQAELDAHTPYPAKRLTGLPKPVAARVCRLLVTDAGGAPPERLHVEAMLDIAAGGNGRKRNMAGGLTAAKKNGMIVVEKTNRRNDCYAPGFGEDTADGE
ncbi:MAG: tRNA lysidine(34) synthetase TilS [Oscillospiraceae bacterium]|nr:tRNA lysidine(34) synthetase TilS [Oscillospiraceae bacterium]